jgi:hypothetical protein
VSLGACPGEGFAACKVGYVSIDLGAIGMVCVNRITSSGRTIFDPDSSRSRAAASAPRGSDACVSGERRERRAIFARFFLTCVLDMEDLLLFSTTRSSPAEFLLQHRLAREALLRGLHQNSFSEERCYLLGTIPLREV